MSETVKTFVWIPFGDLMHEDSPGGPNWQKTQMNPGWWLHRVKVMEQFTLRALENQTDKGFAIMAGIAEEAGDMPEPLIRLSNQKYFRVHRHPVNDPHIRGQTPSPCAVQMMLRECDVARVVWNDSDDMYAKGALAEFMRQSTQAGQVCAFKKGYIAQTDWQRAQVYFPTNAFPPFFSRIYTQDAARNVDAYEKQWNYHNSHGWLSRSKRLTQLSDGQFCVMVHGQNMSTHWENERVRAKLGPRLTDREIEAMRKEFGQ